MLQMWHLNDFLFFVFFCTVLNCALKWKLSDIIFAPVYLELPELEFQSTLNCAYWETLQISVAHWTKHRGNLWKFLCAAKKCIMVSWKSDSLLFIDRWLIEKNSYYVYIMYTPGKKNHIFPQKTVQHLFQNMATISGLYLFITKCLNQYPVVVSYTDMSVFVIFFFLFSRGTLTLANYSCCLSALGTLLGDFFLKLGWRQHN